MKERPILFSGPMVRAILAGTKTQTRRVLREQPPSPGQYAGSPAPDKAFFREDLGLWWLVPANTEDSDPSPATLYEYRCPYGVPGDRLWVRETWSHDPDLGANCDDHRCGIESHIWYYATEDPDVATTFGGSARWRPSIFMPRWASRITLEVTGVRVQRVQEISEEDAWAEGVFPPTWETDGLCFSRDHQHIDARPAFACLWDSINAKRAPWDSNPWVWAITFRRLAA